MDYQIVRPLEFSDFLNNAAKPFLIKISELETKINTYSDIELKKYGGSNFVLHYNEGVLNIIRNKIKVYENTNYTLYNLQLINALDESYHAFYVAYEETNDEIAKIVSSKEGSKAFPNWGSKLESCISETAIMIIAVLDEYISHIEVQRITTEYQAIDRMRIQFQNVIDEKTESINRIETKLGQILYDRDILSLRDFYAERERTKKKEYKINKVAYGICFAFIIAFVLYLLSDLLLINFVFNNQNLDKSINSIVVYVLVITLTGLVSFLMNDFRKRMNISKTILDEIEQKKVFVDSYSVLLEKKKDISNDNKEKYEIDLILSMFNNLLTIRNYGYTHKDMQTMSPNMIIDLINRTINRK